MKEFPVALNKVLRPSLFRALLSVRGLSACAVAAAVVAVAAVSIESQTPFAIFPFSICSAQAREELPDEAPFLAENDAAMNKMMADMSVKPTGDVDRDFVEMMVPHHQGAIDMAQALLRHGHNEQLRRLAQEIIVTQQQEIAAMRLALGDKLPPSAPSPTQPEPAQASNQPAPHGGMSHGMMPHDPTHSSMSMK
jgi:hypothetical protein